MTYGMLDTCPHTERDEGGRCIPCTRYVALGCALVRAFVALRERHLCRLPVDCGGYCHRIEGHAGDCTCSGTEVEECPA